MGGLIETSSREGVPKGSARDGDVRVIRHDVAPSQTQRELSALGPTTTSVARATVAARADAHLPTAWPLRVATKYARTGFIVRNESGQAWKLHALIPPSPGAPLSVRVAPEVSAVPEPPRLALFAIGMLALGVFRLRRASS